MCDSSELYQRLFKVYRINYPKGSEAQTNVNIIWKDAKARFKNKIDFSNFIEEEIKNGEIRSLRQKSNMINYFCRNISKYF